MMIFDELRIGEQFRPWDQPANKVYTKQRPTRRNNSTFHYIVDGRTVYTGVDNVPGWKPVIRHESKTKEG